MRTRLNRVLHLAAVLAVMAVTLAPTAAHAVVPNTSPPWCGSGGGILMCYQINGHDEWVSNFTFGVIGNSTGVSPAVISYEVTGPGGWVYPTNNPGEVTLNNGSRTSRTINVSTYLPPGNWCGMAWTDWGSFVSKCWMVE